MLTFYGYDGCDTCRKAKKALRAADVAFDFVDITQHPPPKKLFQAIVKSGDYTLGQLLNRSGAQYRDLKLKDRLPKMKPDEVIALLAGNGRLCKRPIVTNGKRHTVGYDPARFADVWKT